MDNMEQVQNTVQGQTTEPNGKNGGEQKVFTQEEVDRIVKNRLIREREKNHPEHPDPMDEKEQEFAKREMIFEVKELLISEKCPTKLADILQYSSMEEFKEQYEALKEFMPSFKGNKVYVKSTTGGYHPKKEADDRLREAMRL
jgi:hypothetical protein